MESARGGRGHNPAEADRREIELRARRPIYGRQSESGTRKVRMTFEEVLGRIQGFWARFDRMVMVRCRCCGNERQVHYGQCLREGWPECCRQIMELQRVEEAQ